LRFRYAPRGADEYEVDVRHWDGKGYVSCCRFRTPIDFPKATVPGCCR
jgi:hypothetical protein